MASVSSNLTVSNASLGASTGRNKVGLKPGHSLMDWIRYTHSSQDLTTTGGKCIEVSPRELSKHNIKKDAWIALKGKVYNITPYLDYHPGGEEELMRGAGKDATDLFNQIHRWVNAESMLQKCFIGFLKKSWSLDASRFLSVKPLKKQKIPKITPESTSSTFPRKETIVVSSSAPELYTIPSSSVHREASLSLSPGKNKVVLVLLSSDIKCNEVITELIEENLFIKVNKNFNVPWLKIELPGIAYSNYEVKVPQSDAKGNLEISFNKETEGYSKDTKVNLMWSLCDKGAQSLFWPCKLIDKSSINYNTYLFTFLLPSNVKMWIPIGCHVFVKSDIEGMEITRSYTPVHPLDSDKDDLSDGCHILLMIKIYPAGTLTPLINMINIGENMLISNYTGSFSETLVERCDFILMVAAGTGITPMIKIITWTLTATDKKRSILLLFFNKTEEDILWREELEKCSKKWDNFQVTHILSNSNKNWNGFTGAISEDTLQKTLPPKISGKQQVLICGPPPFTESAVRLFEKSGYNQEYICAFTG